MDAWSLHAIAPASLCGFTSTKAQDKTPSLSWPSFRRRPSAVLLCECLLDDNGSKLDSYLVQKVESKTSFIDDEVMGALAQKPGDVRQIILVTDGEEHRLYRLPWPPFTLIFRMSSSPVREKWRGEKVPKSCLVRDLHVDLEESAGSGGWAERLRSAGYQGDKPSVWTLQGIDLAGPEILQNILENISCLAMKGSLLIGELSSSIIGSSSEKSESRQLLEKIFTGCGFRVKSMGYENESYTEHIVFAAEQLRLSDDQVQRVTREMELAEESGDEEAFEDW